MYLPPTMLPDKGMDEAEFSTLLPQLVANYRPDPQVLSKLRNVTLVGTIGPSGVGKSTLMRASGWPLVLGDATRTVRPGEMNGVDYNFRKDFDQILKELQTGQFVQVAIGSGGDLKATRQSAFPESGTATMAIVADVIPIFRRLGFKQFMSIFISVPSFDEWMRRIAQREGDTPEQLEKRFAEAKRSLEFALTDDECLFVLNDNINVATTDLRAVAEGDVDPYKQRDAKAAAERMLKAVNEHRL